MRSPGSRLAGHSKPDSSCPAASQTVPEAWICAVRELLRLLHPWVYRFPSGVKHLFMTPWKSAGARAAAAHARAGADARHTLHPPIPGVGAATACPAVPTPSTTQLPGLRRGAEAKGAAARPGAGRLTPGAGCLTLPVCAHPGAAARPAPQRGMYPLRCPGTGETTGGPRKGATAPAAAARACAGLTHQVQTPAPQRTTHVGIRAATVCPAVQIVCASNPLFQPGCKLRGEP